MHSTLLLLVCALAATARGGPQNVLVNTTSPDSDEVGPYYVEKRRIPARNVVRLRCPVEARGFRAEHVGSGADALVDKRDIIGYMSGGCYSKLTREGIRRNTYRPGSIVDMLESFGAVPQNFDPDADPSQFPVTFFLDLGVAGIHGTVHEPYAHTFPSAKLFERYTEGYNLAETFPSPSSTG